MTETLRYASIALIGLILLGLGVWFYHSYTPSLAEPFDKSPVECSGGKYGIPPSYLGEIVSVKGYIHYRNGTVIERDGGVWRIHVINDACRDGYAEVVIESSLLPAPMTYNLTLDQLSSLLISSLDLPAIYGHPSSAVTGLGPAQALQISLPPRIVAGPDNQSYYYQFNSYYYHPATGLLLKIESQSIFGVGNNSTAPDLVLQQATVEDVHSAPGPSGGFESYSRSVELGVAISMVSAAYIIIGLILLGYGVARLIA